MYPYHLSIKLSAFVYAVLLVLIQTFNVMALECKGACQSPNWNVLLKPTSRSIHDEFAAQGHNLVRSKNHKHVSRIGTIHRRNAHHHKTASHKHKKGHKNVISSVNVSTPAIRYVTASGTEAFSSLLEVTSSCGPANPTSSITTSSGPNGQEEFFNCGITGDGWDPAKVTLPMIKTVSLAEEPAKSTYAPCEQYRPLFEKYGKKYNVPPIFLAAFAMQESSCRSDVKGDNGGAFGLMQITQDKCDGAPEGDCTNPDFNVDIGAKTFADGLSQSDGNVLVAIGQYNGWSQGLTESKALEAKNWGCCVCQQNLDYLHQFLNGWVLGVNPYSHGLGTVRNLDPCADDS